MGHMCFFIAPAARKTADTASLSRHIKAGTLQEAKTSTNYL